MGTQRGSTVSRRKEVKSLTSESARPKQRSGSIRIGKRFDLQFNTDLKSSSSDDVDGEEDDEQFTTRQSLLLKKQNSKSNSPFFKLHQDSFKSLQSSVNSSSSVQTANLNKAAAASQRRSSFTNTQHYNNMEKQIYLNKVNSKLKDKEAKTKESSPPH